MRDEVLELRFRHGGEPVSLGCLLSPPPIQAPPAAPGLQVDGALFKSEGHLLELAGRVWTYEICLTLWPGRSTAEEPKS